MSAFTAKRRNASRPAYTLNLVEMARRYADHYGYEPRGGWIYNLDGERVAHGWKTFADQLVQRGAIEPGVGFGLRFAAGDRAIVNSTDAEQYEITVTRVGRVDICPIYYFTNERGHEDSVYDSPRLAAA